MNRTSDPVTLEIIRGSFYATVRQAGRIVLRSSFSPIIRDAFDFCVTLVGPRRPDDGLDLDIIAMNESLAHFSGVMPFAVRNLVSDYGYENLEEGDLLVLNNPYKGGNHLYDTTFLKPVFVAGEPVGAVAAKVHLMDLGGAMAGGYSIEKRSIWEEGVAISGVPVYRNDEPYIPGFNLFFDNSRLPDNMLGDIQAVHSACSFADGRLQQLVEKYSAETVFEAMGYTLEYARDSMRKAIAKLPDGVYEGEDGLDRDGFEDSPHTIHCQVTKHGEQLEVDLSGTTRQSGSAINCPAYDAANAVYTAVKFLCDPTTPNSSGAFEPIDVVVPEGCFVAALPPAATTLYFDAAEAVFNAVVKALRPALPEGAFGGHFGTNMGFVITGPGGPRGTFVAPMISLGGFGASNGSDGENYISMSQQNVMDMAVEAIEEDYPLMITRKEMLTDRSGPGRWRGGAGVVFDRVVLRESEVRPLILRLRRLPWGVAGGLPGRAGAALRGVVAESHQDLPAHWIQPGTDPLEPDAALDPISGTFDEQGRPVAPGEGTWTSRVAAEQAAPNTLYRVITPGGGGWGNPLDRDPAAVLLDVRDGLVSIEGAARDYGVVLSGDPLQPGSIAVDEPATELTRKERR